MQQPENQSKKYTTLFTGIDDGYIKVPQFQREFVWDKPKTARLIDSIIKGFPIGTFILWKTHEELRHIRNIGNTALPPTPKGDATSYVLDGQQRITSLYAVRKGLIITKDGVSVDYKDLSIALEVDPEQRDEVVSVDPPLGQRFISVYDLLNQNLVQLMASFSAEEIQKIDVYRARLQGYDFSVISIDNYPIDIACEIFTRINTGGQELTLFEIMVAKTYDQATGFDLAEKFSALRDGDGNDDDKDLRAAGFETVPPIIVLQSVAAHLRKQITRADILKLPKQDFIGAWETVTSGLFSAVDWIRSVLRIPVSSLIPYPSQLVPLTYFFIRNNGASPTAAQNKFLTQYFFWGALGKRFTSGVESKVAQDLLKMDLILKDEAPLYEREDNVEIDADDLKYHWFSTNDAFCKGILCILAYQQPKSFASNAIVHLDNSWLKQINSKNYHHFFPRAFLEKQGIEDWKANSVVNITIVDDFLNKRVIKAKAPSQYMKKFVRQNDDIEEAMRSHLVGNLEEFGIETDDYETFLAKRTRWLLKEIAKRMPSFPETLAQTAS
jgi:hypothetical protein